MSFLKLWKHLWVRLGLGIGLNLVKIFRMERISELHSFWATYFICYCNALQIPCFFFFFYIFLILGFFNLWIKIETVSLIQFRQANMSGIDIVIVWWPRYQNWQCLIYFKSMEYPRTLELFHVFRGCRKGRYTTYTFTILKLWIALEKLTHWLHHQRNIAWIRKTASNPC